MTDYAHPAHGGQARILVGKSTEQQVEITSWTTGVLVFLVVLWALFGPKLGRLHLTEGSAACILGLLCGSLLLAGRHYIAQQAVVQRLMVFSAASFFTYLLPPVIFYAGLSIEKTLFFRNLGSILALGVLGTVVCALVMAAMLVAGFAGFRVLRIQDCLALGAIFSATDSVATLQVLNPDRQPILFSLVFGEGVINDATSVVLLGAISSIYPTAGASATPEPTSGWDNMVGIALTFVYLFVTSLALGAATGTAISCLVVRFAAHGPHHEVALIGLLSYLSYLAAEVLGLSGILSLFCCGLTVSQFGLDNISEVGRTTTLSAFHTMSYICEGIIFIYLGMDALDPAKWHAARAGEVVSLCGALLLLLLVSRAAAVLPITWLHNWLHPAKLSSTDIVIVWWSGLMRGAVSVALAYYYFDIGAPTGSTGDRHYSTLIVATLVVVLFTTVLMGGATQPLLQLLVADPDMSLKDKVVRGLRTLQLRSSNLAAATCCCLTGRSSRGPSSSGLRSAAPLPKRDTGSGAWWGRTAAPFMGFQAVSSSEDVAGGTDGDDVSTGREDQWHTGAGAAGQDVELGPTARGPHAAANGPQAVTGLREGSMVGRIHSEGKEPTVPTPTLRSAWTAGSDWGHRGGPGSGEGVHLELRQSAGRGVGEVGRRPGVRASQAGSGEPEGGGDFSRRSPQPSKGSGTSEKESGAGGVHNEGAGYQSSGSQTRSPHGHYEGGGGLEPRESRNGHTTGTGEVARTRPARNVSVRKHP